MKILRGKGTVRLCIAVSKSLSTGKPVVKVAQAPYNDQHTNPFWITLKEWRRWSRGAKVIHSAG